ncbi:hypothetical protein Ahy_A04g017290 [Arachis hypogaea]|uniref:CCHC-type domain-containing protein n=1 Tax=Arachis hypogaea TaxID=3818 RepID=A0A445DAL7_ARAHY|nr:hypothetical protein Ahy_A04g017290 [Arachis hypogaea]
MVNCARTNDRVIDVYFEHGVPVSEELEGDNTVIYLDDNGGEGCNTTTDVDVSLPLNKTTTTKIRHLHGKHNHHTLKPKIKSGKLKMKRRMDADEKSGLGTKKPKLSNSENGVYLKRQLKTFTCSFCGEKGHTKRGCKKKRMVDATAAAAATAEAVEKKKKDEGHPAPEQQEQPQNDGDQGDGKSNPVSQPVEIEISQPTASEAEDSQQDPSMKRPSKLSPKRKSSLPATSPTVNPLQGASLATKFVNLMKFIPTLMFKPPRKKN